MPEDPNLSIRNAQLLFATRRALQDGTLKFAPGVSELANELIRAPLTMMGLVDTSKLSPEAISFGRTAGMALTMIPRDEIPQSSSSPMSDIQQELFRLYGQVFSALTGRSERLVSSVVEIKERILWRFTHEFDAMASATNQALDELGSFYQANAVSMFQHAKGLGGMRLVTGGQRAFGPSALNAVRITGLYADTQLIPDPIYPYLTSDLHLNARHLQLARDLFFILQLRALVDLDLPVPPVFVFPSFEQSLEQNDPVTKYELEQLVMRMVGPLCEGTVSSLEDLFDYANRKSDGFARALLEHQLFVPPGGEADKRIDVKEAVAAYLGALEGVRTIDKLDKLKSLPPGVLLLNGVLERLRPHYHLLENANELDAQPLLSQPVQWHYFEKCANANAQQLRRQGILSGQAFGTLRAVQDNSLSWLANIPISTLAELIANGEHQWLRGELNHYTAQLTSASAFDADSMVRELNHALASLAQRQKTAMAEIEKKYSPKKIGILAGVGAGLAVVATASFLPILAPLLVAGAPVAAAAAALTGGAIGYGKEKAGELVEKHQASRSMLGVLAVARQGR